MGSCEVEMITCSGGSPINDFSLDTWKIGCTTLGNLNREIYPQVVLTFQSYPLVNRNIHEIKLIRDQLGSQSPGYTRLKLGSSK